MSTVSTDDNIWKPGDPVLVKLPGERHLSHMPATVVHAAHPVYTVKVALDGGTHTLRYTEIRDAERHD